MGLLDFLKKEKPAEAEHQAEQAAEQPVDQTMDAGEQALADVPEQQPMAAEAPQMESPAAAPAPGRSTPPFPGRILRQGVSGEDVRMWQAKMVERGWDLDVDGAYGPGCASACRRFQKEKGLSADGEVGQQTWTATWNAPVT